MVSRRLTLAVLGLIVVGAPGCRQLFGIEDTELAGDDALDAPRADGGPGSPDAKIDDLIDGPMPVVDAMPVACPFEYVYSYGGHRYRFMAFPETWTYARDDCADDVPGTHLVIPDDIAENTQISQWITQRTWIGISDIDVESVLRTVLGVTPPPLLNWENDNPNNDTNTDCATMRDAVGTNPGTWRMESCGLTRPYVCECPGPGP